MVPLLLAPSALPLELALPPAPPAAARGEAETLEDTEALGLTEAQAELLLLPAGEREPEPEEL